MVDLVPPFASAPVGHLGNKAVQEHWQYLCIFAVAPNQQV